MKSYLLLRDNKQSGPFTFDEMVSKGFKAYDLVWVEGKSAAWRYPGELEEFKPYAPAVEEQPFDRFFKRPSQQQNTSKQTVEAKSVATSSSAGFEKSPIIEKKEAITFSGLQEADQVTEKKETPKEIPAKEKLVVPKFPKYVAVSLPSAKNNSTNVVVVKKPEQPVEEKKKILNQESAADAYNKIIAAEKNSADKKQVVIAEERTPIQQAPKLNEYFYENEETRFLQTAQATRRKAPIIQAIAVAAAIISLVAVGVLIGMSIAGDSPKQDLPAQETQKVNTNPSNLIEEKTESDKDNDLKISDIQQPIEPSTSEELVIVPSKKNSTEAKSKKPTHVELKSETMDEPSAAEKLLATPVVSNKTEKESNPETVAKEAARKNIGHLVSLDVDPYKVGMFGGISDLHLTVSNNSSYPIDLVVVEVKYIQSNKKIFKTETLQFKDISPNSFMSLDVPKTNKGIKVESKITYITSKDLDLSYNAW